MSKDFDGKFKSLLEEVENDPSASREMAAARLASEALRVLNVALLTSGLSQKDLSEKLGVTESAISQTLFGDGNLRIYTFARYLKALGCEVSLGLKSEGVLIPTQVARLRVRRNSELVAAGEFGSASKVAFTINENSNGLDESVKSGLASGESQPKVDYGIEKLGPVVGTPLNPMSTTAADFSLAA